MGSALRRLFRRPSPSAPRRERSARPSLEALEERQMLTATLKGDYDGDRRTDMVVYRPSDGNFYLKTSRSGYTDGRWVNFGSQPGDVLIRDSDFDGDRKADLAVWRPSTGTWFYATSSDNFATYYWCQWGLQGDIPLEASDFDGDGRHDLAVYRPSNGTWYVTASNYGRFNTTIARQHGVAGDMPLVGSDFDGDGRTDMAVWRPSDGVWYMLQSNYGGFNRYDNVRWGVTGDIPMKASDFDGDRRDDLALFRPSDGTWWVATSRTNFSTGFGIQYGLTGDIPIPNSDFDGDGRADMALFRPGDGTWYVLASNYGSFNYDIRRQYGAAGDLPLPNSDFDGDGRADMGVWRPGDGTWYVRHSNYGNFNTETRRQWGLAGDRPAVGPTGDGRKVLYLQFDGATLSRADLVRYAGSEWTWGADGWGGSIDGDRNGVTVSAYRNGQADREQIISRTFQMLQADLGQFGITVARLGAGQRAVENQGATTAFVGSGTFTGSGFQGIAYDIDVGNDNRTDICFNLPFTTGTVDQHATRMASLILHEAGHTWGQYHTNAPSTSGEAMALSYTFGHGPNVQFNNTTYTLLEDTRFRQNSYQSMMAWAFGAPSGLTNAATGAPATLSGARPNGCGCSICSGKANRRAAGDDVLLAATAMSGDVYRDATPAHSSPRRELRHALPPAEPAPAGAPVDDVMIEIGRAHAPHRPADDFLTGLEDDPFAILY